MSRCEGCGYTESHEANCPTLDEIERLKRELNAALICAGVASKERGEWAAEREDLIEKAALECDREADRQAAFEGSARGKGVRMIHAASAHTLMAVAQRIRTLKGA